MSYTVHTRGGQIYNLDDQDGFDLKVQWLEAKKPFPIELGDDTMMSGQITKITKDKLTQADLPRSDRPALPERSCKAQYGIQLEINRIAKDSSRIKSDDNPKARAWPVLIRDRKWRDGMRQKLRATGAQWCDDRAGECACEPGYIARAGRHNV